MLAPLQALPASAQGSWPEKPIRLVVPYPPGGALEVSARILVDKIAPSLGQSIVVEARPGADGNLGTEAVAKSAPDGIVMATAGNGVVGCADEADFVRSPSVSTGSHPARGVAVSPLHPELPGR